MQINYRFNKTSESRDCDIKSITLQLVKETKEFKSQSKLKAYIKLKQTYLKPTEWLKDKVIY